MITETECMELNFWNVIKIKDTLFEGFDWENLYSYSLLADCMQNYPLIGVAMCCWVQLWHKPQNRTIRLLNSVMILHA